MWFRGGVVTCTAAASVLACSHSGGQASSDSASANGSTTLSYQIVTSPREAPRSTPPVVYIDGVAQTELALQFPSALDALGVDHVVELRDGDIVISRIDLRGRDVEDCASQNPVTSVASFRELICEYDSGDLRLGAEAGTTRLQDGSPGQCSIDGSASCGPECTEWTCGANTHCTSIVTSHSPMYSHLGCAPIGTVPVGSPCTFTSGSSGDYDNCGSGAVCVSGTCHALCTDTCGTCGTVDGEPAELRFCM